MIELFLPEHRTIAPQSDSTKWRLHIAKISNEIWVYEAIDRAVVDRLRTQVGSVDIVEVESINESVSPTEDPISIQVCVDKQPESLGTRCPEKSNYVKRYTAERMREY